MKSQTIPNEYLISLKSGESESSVEKSGFSVVRKAGNFLVVRPKEGSTANIEELKKVTVTVEEHRTHPVAEK